MSITAEKIALDAAKLSKRVTDEEAHAIISGSEKWSFIKGYAYALLQQDEPEGWKLVPVEPTRPMLDAALHSSRSWTEPYTAPRESGVAIDSDIDEELAETINEAGRQGYANDYKAMPLP